MNFKRDTRFTRELNKVPTLETCGAEAIWTVLASRWDFETSLGGPFDLEMVSQIWNTPPNYLWYAIHACYVRTFSGRNYRLTTNYHLDLSASPHVKKVSGREGNRWQKLPWNGTDDDLPPEGREVHLEGRVEHLPKSWSRPNANKWRRLRGRRWRTGKNLPLCSFFFKDGVTVQCL